MTEPLFDIDPARTVPGPEPEPDPNAGLSADRKRTKRQRAQLAKGRHPITGYTLHPEAAPGDDRAAPGRRCGDCVFREQMGYHRRTYAKCVLPGPSGGTPYVTHGAGTDVRAWWPGCQRHEHRPTPDEKEA